MFDDDETSLKSFDCLYKDTYGKKTFKSHEKSSNGMLIHILRNIDGRKYL